MSELIGGSPLEQATKHNPGLVILIALGLTIITSGLGCLLGRSAAIPFGALAAPVGLCTWVLHSKGLDRLILDFSDNAQRSGLFRGFLIEVFLWAGLVLLSYFIPVLISRSKTNDDGMAGDKTTKLQGESAKQSLFNCLSGVGLVCLAGFLVLKVLAQSTGALAGESPAVAVITAPKIGQVLFAIYVSFFIGAWGVKHLFRVPTWPLLIGPAIVAFTSYVLASRIFLPQTLIDQAPAFVRPTVNFAMTLPLQMIAVGSLAILVAHWPALVSDQSTLSNSASASPENNQKQN